MTPFVRCGPKGEDVTSVLDRMQRDVPLASLTTLGVGGTADWWVEVRDAAECAEVHHWAEERGLPLLVLGGGSNVVVADRGVTGLVVRIGTRAAEWQDEAGEVVVRAGAGMPWTEVVEAAVGRGLAGVECLAGIPGRVGGTPIQNVGAYGQEVSRVIESVEAFDSLVRAVTTMTAEQCGFGYRTSRFRGVDAGRFTILRVTFRLRPGPPTTTYEGIALALREQGITTPGVRDVYRTVLTVRQRKGMVLDPADSDTCSVGSFFTNPVLTEARVAELEARFATAPVKYRVEHGIKVAAAWLIQQSGFTPGWRTGATGLSGKHVLAIVNRGQARAGDIVRCASEIQRRVRDSTGVRLSVEPVFIGFGDDPGVEALRARTQEPQ